MGAGVFQELPQGCGISDAGIGTPIPYTVHCDLPSQALANFSGSCSPTYGRAKA